jgi:hypothetical protein
MRDAVTEYAVKDSTILSIWCYELFDKEGMSLGYQTEAYCTKYKIPIYHDAQRWRDEKKAERHPSSARFHAILKELGELHDKKQQDYGRETDPFANVRASQDWGMPGWVGCMMRANDKMKRLQTYSLKGTLANESVRDSFLDLAVYAVIGLCLHEEEQAVKKK